MALLSTVEIEEMHDTYAEAMVDECVIRTDADVLVATVNCAVMKRRRQSMPGGGLAPIDKPVDFTVSLPLDTAVTTNQTITVTDKSLRLRVGEVIHPATSYDHCIFAETVIETLP